MIWRILADLVLFVHLGFVVFVLAGGLFVRRWPGLAWVHLPAALWGVIIEFAGWVCPLTPLENWLRRRGGAEGFSGGFIEHYLLKTLYPDGLTHRVQIAIGIFVIVINVFAYWRVARS